MSAWYDVVSRLIAWWKRIGGALPAGYLLTEAGEPLLQEDGCYLMVSLPHAVYVPHVAR
jgi:hypothetical protein